MRIQNQVCTYEQAVKLRELGVSQDSLHYINSNHLVFNPEVGKKQNLPSAYTVAELGVMLPEKFKKFIYEHNNTVAYKIKFYEAYGALMDFRFTKPENIQRATDLIYLLEHKIISIELVNKRLTDS